MKHSNEVKDTVIDIHNLGIGWKIILKRLDIPEMEGDTASHYLDKAVPQN